MSARALAKTYPPRWQPRGIILCSHCKNYWVRFYTTIISHYFLFVKQNGKFSFKSKNPSPEGEGQSYAALKSANRLELAEELQNGLRLLICLSQH
ncbi:MAG: hypothetical protein ACI4QY_06475, partial [Oscillospiraceae bacterium]